MGFQPKQSLDEQVIVITGASSGIGLATARLACEAGAKVVIAARSAEIERIADELRTSCAGSVEPVIADVGVEDDVRRIAARAIERFGRIDTWINNAGVSVYGRSIDVPIEDMRELFDTDFWGVVHGSRIAIEHLRDEGGTLINVGSVVSDRAIPLQGAYSAAKHAVKGFTDALRMELEHDRLPIQVTLIKPATIDTPYFAHAKNHLDEGVPAAPPPVYAPEAVARTMLRCATRPTREVAVGMGGRVQFVLARLAPGLADKLMERALFGPQIRSTPHEARTEGPGEERGDHQGMVLQRSAYAELRTWPVLAGIAAGIGAAMAAIGASRLASRSA
ncbi:MAG: SDR family oxidoreductase [Myxococcota bacterium]|nr:SDR family oxidoreductase [Myxococcota bacterium]